MYSVCTVCDGMGCIHCDPDWDYGPDYWCSECGDPNCDGSCRDEDWTVVEEE